MIISYNDVPALTKMLGPDITKFKGQSERIDALVDDIEIKLSTSLTRQAEREAKRRESLE